MLPRVLIALKNEKLTKQLSKHFGAQDILLNVSRGNGELLAELHGIPSDLLILGKSLIPHPPLASLANIKKLPESPAVVIISEKEDPIERADLLSMGAEAVLHLDLPFSRISRVIETVLDKRGFLEKQAIDLDSVMAEPRLSDFVSQSPAMKSFMDVVYNVVKSDASLLLLGETGVGKERLARAIHAESLRVSGPFVPVNCGALPETLLESELFGHEKGSFTGATRQRRGCFELAHGGTVFLDEIGDLPYHLQVKLLRVLQEHEVQRVGSETSFRVDVRIITATNQDLGEQVRSNRFRRDLYYRLNVISLTIPPLRERKEDIPELLTSYIGYFRPRIRKNIKGFSKEAMEVLLNYDWPGNVREMINVVERAILLCPGEEITLTELPEDILEKSSVRVGNIDLKKGGFDSIRLPGDWRTQPIRKMRKVVVGSFERSYLDNLLKETGGRIGETARRAGIQTRALFEKMKKYNLDKSDYKQWKKQLDL